MNQVIELGSVVKAIAGRDKDNFFVVVGVINDEYVFIANGKNRTITNPKKKKLKHLKSTNLKVDTIADKLKDGKKVFDSEVFSAIKICLPKN